MNDHLNKLLELFIAQKAEYDVRFDAMLDAEREMNDTSRHIACIMLEARGTQHDTVTLTEAGRAAIENSDEVEEVDDDRLIPSGDELYGLHLTDVEHGQMLMGDEIGDGLPLPQPTASQVKQWQADLNRIHAIE